MKVALFLSVVLITRLAASAEILFRSAAELSDYMDRTPQTEIRFDVTGTVLQTSTTTRTNYTGIVLLEDASGRVSVFNAQPVSPEPGTVIRASGDGNIERDGNPLVCIRRMTCIGQAPVPPPLDIPLRKLSAPEHAYRLVRTEGTLIEVVPDEVDDRNGFLILKDGDTVIPVSINRKNLTNAQPLVGARLRICGRYYSRIDGIRRYSGPYIGLFQPYEIVKPPPANPFDVPPLDFRRNQSPRDISRLEMRRTCGRVLAAWAEERMIVRSTEGDVLNVELAKGLDLPSPGQTICVVGYPQTDLFRIKLIKARWKSVTDDGMRPSVRIPPVLPLRRLLPGYDDYSSDVPESYHGQVVCTEGIVQDCHPVTAMTDGELRISDSGRSLRVICPRGLTLPNLPPGATVRVTGICCQPCEDWQPYLVFPHIHDCQIILTHPSDIVIIRRPPWLTPLRVAVIVFLLVAALLLVFIWNRLQNRIIIRRSRELAREQLSHLASELKADERTRLAVELHDTLSQNLAGLACLLGTSESALPDNTSLAQRGLATANRMLQSCRTELRHCLFDLRNDTLEEPDFATAIRKTLAQLDSEADISVRFAVPRSRFHDATAHAILNIIRELVSNALRHGNATSVRIAGSIENDVLLFSVTDNGTGFDPETCLGPSDGHFGIDGIRERLSRRNGRLVYRSRPGQTCARIEIPLPHDNETATEKT